MKFLNILISTVLFITITNNVFAATKKPVKKPTIAKKVIKKVIKQVIKKPVVKKPVVKSAPAGSPSLSAKVRKASQDVVVTFVNLSRVKSISYTLAYDSANKGSQGVVGSITVGKFASISRTLVFATASSGVYSYHTGITGAYIEATFNMKDGKAVTKTVNLNVPF